MTSPEILDDLRYPVGKFDKSAIDPARRAEYIGIIADLPKTISVAVDGLDDAKLDTPYRPSGWTVRQTVHHVADSHINSYCRFKLALTENNPMIRPYEEGLWADLADSELPVEVSLKLIDGLHLRWAALLRSMTPADFEKTVDHPESGQWNLDGFLALYAWHSRHHTAHISRLREREGW